MPDVLNVHLHGHPIGTLTHIQGNRTLFCAVCSFLTGRTSLSRKRPSSGANGPTFLLFNAPVS
jgi:hypothetical protein